MVRHRYRVPVVQRPIQQPIAQKEEGTKYFKKTILYLGVVFGIILIGVIIYYLFLRTGEPEKLMDLKIKSLDEEVKIGEDLNYEVEALNLGTFDIYDITLRYDIYNLEGKYFPSLRKEETVALKDKSVFPQTFKAELAPGTYELKVTATYGDERAVASETFEILGENATEQPQPEPSPEPQPQPEPEPTPQPQPEPEEYNFNQITGMSDSELERQALANANSDYIKAIDSCLSISSEYNADYCLNLCSEESKRSEFCRPIKDNVKKDNCYMSLALDNQPELCNRIIDGYKKNTCLALI